MRRRSAGASPACRTTRVATIIRNTGGGITERFLIDNRQRCNGDTSVGSQGIVVWYQKDDTGNGDPLYSANDTNVAVHQIRCAFSGAAPTARSNPAAVTGRRQRDAGT